MPNTNPLIASIDAGGTSFKCGMATLEGHIVARARVGTTTPNETLGNCIAFFAEELKQQQGKIISLGIASFGPIDINPHSPSYGTILETPKPGWSQTDLKAAFLSALNVPVAIDTDVNGALLAELQSGAAQDCTSAAYVTIGTGIGAGLYANGALLGHPSHPEFGHICVTRDPDDSYQGTCIYHGDCLEGLASATAFMARFGAPQNLADDHPGWQLEANYLAQACWSLSLSFRPQRIILGGGLMIAPHLIGMVREAYSELSGGYLGQNSDQVRALIVRPHHGDDAGLQGGFYLARQNLD